ncbi:MAG: flavodoxin-dependent (E)-4-hydroxy-3-methylbut-2-enyl-diphosphate synthase, partial [Anaplasmataceae bacterium]|nr:flavodoxin-dependent (E)-4-hydroxy-3-methylbut-2-enyl-diphosphate synthase [Anaplasmataceae bacterium]
AEEIGLPKDKIILSCKVSKVPSLIKLYTILAKLCKYPLHLGLTEVGFPPRGLIATSVAFSPLLLNGIGSTIRASLTQRKNESRTDEVYLCREILNSLEMRKFHPTLTSCPGCGRAKGQFFREVAEKVEIYTKSQTPLWQEQYYDVEKMTVAVMGCTVNGPGESKHANIGISLPGYQEKTTSAAVYMNGKYHSTIRGKDIADEFCLLIDKYAEDNYPHK